MDAWGLDFGTTNSALALSSESKVAMIGIDPFNRADKIMRSVIYFDNEGGVFVGQEAINKYTDNGGEGRFMQSIKSFLPNMLFEHTTINRKQYELEDLIAILLKNIKSRAEKSEKREMENVVIGRPVVFSEDKDRDALAETRLLKAAEKSGFKQIVFQLEPIAASLAFESTLPGGEERIALVGDFGGGTSDFSVVRLHGGNSHRSDRVNDILSLGGVYVAGDAFDSMLMWEKVAKYFGKDAKYQSMTGQWLEMPASIMFKLKNWHLIPQLRSRKVREVIRGIKYSADNPELIENLEHLIEDNFGFMLFQAIEKAKIELSSYDSSKIAFNERQLNIAEEVTKQEFEIFIKDHVSKIEACIDDTVSRAGLEPRDIDVVLTTGGTSYVPRVKNAFMSRFGQKKLKQMEAFTSVAHGLGIYASKIFR